MSKKNKLENYNPSDVGVKNGHIFGMPFSFEESDIIILPVPWEVTASFGSGSALAPKQILEASTQLDLYHLSFPDVWKQGIFMLSISIEIQQLNKQYKTKAQEVIRLLENGKSMQSLEKEINEINDACNTLRKWVFTQCKTLLNRGKKVILLGGDHSTPLGFIQALATQYSSFGILQIDAHADLRNTYEGFTYSHASIMHNALKIENISSLTQVGIRDLAIDEAERIDADKRIHCFYDERLQAKRMAGETWKEQVDKIIATLPTHVYISFDIDGLDPKLCPNTGTPVPSGLTFAQAIYLIQAVKLSKRTIIGCDLNEVGASAWDANVGARVLYQLCCIR